MGWSQGFLPEVGVIWFLFILRCMLSSERMEEKRVKTGTSMKIGDGFVVKLLALVFFRL